MALARVMNHRAVPLRVAESGTWIEGELDESVDASPAFRCAFFQGGTREQNTRGRRIDQPQLIFMDPDPDGVPVGLSALDKVQILEAADVGPDDAGIYQVDGPPQPLGRPASRPKGYLAQLKRVVD